MMPLKKPSKGMLLKINQYAMGIMMAKRIPPNTAASTFFIISDCSGMSFKTGVWFLEHSSIV
ncbi:MAG: hypothetical protein ABGY96_15420 [bacterium]